MKTKEIKNFFSQNNIESVLFDMDRTLVDTGSYFRKKMYKAILKIVKEIYENETLIKQTEITIEIQKISTDLYFKNLAPMLVDESTLQAIEKYFSNNNIKYNKKEIYKSLKDFYKNFYNISPSVFPYTVKTLKQINDIGVKMGVYSHAQKSWTKKKIEKIQKAFKNKYKQDLDLPFYTTDINDLKDSIGWKKAGIYHKFDINKTLVVGDSLTSDIYPAIDAGYRCLIYLAHSSPIPKIERKAKVYITENVGTIFD